MLPPAVVAQLEVFRRAYAVLSTNQQAVLAVFFLGFFACTLGVAVVSDRVPLARRGYVAVFFAVLVVVNVTGLSLFPFMYWYKFSEPREQTVTSYEIRVADGNGNEIVYDARAAPPMLNSMSTLARQLDREYDRSTRRVVAQHLLESARDYRGRIDRGGFAPRGVLDFPRHTLDYRWTEERLTGYGTFTAVRVYALSTRTTDDGTTLEARTDRMVLEVTPDRSDSRRERTVPPARHRAVITP